MLGILNFWMKKGELYYIQFFTPNKLFSCFLFSFSLMFLARKSPPRLDYLFSLIDHLLPGWILNWLVKGFQFGRPEHHEVRSHWNSLFSPSWLSHLLIHLMILHQTLSSRIGSTVCRFIYIPLQNKQVFIKVRKKITEILNYIWYLNKQCVISAPLCNHHPSTQKRNEDGRITLYKMKDSSSSVSNKIMLFVANNIMHTACLNTQCTNSAFPDALTLYSLKHRSTHLLNPSLTFYLVGCQCPLPTLP